MKNNLLENKYPWLKIVNTVEDYIEPNYYDRLLKNYVFEGKSDLNHFESYLQNLKFSGKALELGCGNGRATSVFLENMPNIKLDVVDLSPWMLHQARIRFSRYKQVNFFLSDAIRYLQTTREKYNFVFSLWSFSHAVHQFLSKNGLGNGEEEIRNIFEEFIKRNGKKDLKFFLIHFDSLSDEQKILIRQWKKAIPIFRNNKVQSPSKRLIDKILRDLARQKIIVFSSRHYIGKAIEYASLAEALEIFMNFHMESFFNKSPNVAEIINEIESYLKKFQDRNGKIYVKPGCFIYTFQKIA